jgi:hypothetical protein
VTGAGNAGPALAAKVLEGKVAVATGGARVIVGDIDAVGAAAVARSLAPRAEARHLDVGDVQSWADLVDSVACGRSEIHTLDVGGLFIYRCRPLRHASHYGALP